MNGTRTLLTTLAVMASALPAYAVDTTKTYHSGILVLGFLGLCALLVVVQLIPSLIMLFGWVKGLAKGTAETKEKVEVKAS